MLLNTEFNLHFSDSLNGDSIVTIFCVPLDTAERRISPIIITRKMEKKVVNVFCRDIGRILKVVHGLTDHLIVKVLKGC